MELMLGTSNYTRSSGDFPEFPVINMFAEKAPTEDGTSLLSRPGLSPLISPVGTGPVRAVFQQEGILNGDYFYVSGSQLFRNTTSVGTIDGDDFVSIGGFEDFLFVCAGSSLWGYNGTIFGKVPFPDDASVSKIIVGASKLVALKKGSQQFYWSDLLSSVIDSLSFASAENSTDFLYDAQFVGDSLILFGSETVEFWPVADDVNLPFQPLRGRTFAAGIKNTGASVSVNSDFMWVTGNNQICYNSPDNIVSFPGLEAEIASSTNAYMWVFEIYGDTCLGLTLDNKTWVFHSRSQLWSEFSTIGSNKWVAGCYAQGRFGSTVDGKIFSFDQSFTDDGNQLERRFRAWLKITSGGVVINDITLTTNPGQTPFVTGTYVNPSVEMRLSKNGGNTWGPWRTRLLGAIGSYKKWTKWNSNGMFGYPGILAEFRVTDPVPFRVSGVYINEQRGGV